MDAIGDHNTILGRGNITTYTARTSEEILNVQGVRKADLIITDAALPLMGGAKLCAAIRGNADLKNVSIIMTCNGTEESLVQCRDARANAVIPTPIDLVQLFTKISELLVIQQRKELRMPLRATVKGGEEKDSFFGISHNISISGMLVETDRVLKNGERFTSMFTIGHREMVAECAVMRIAKSEGKCHYGVKFLNLDTKSLILIEQFVKGGIKH